MDSNLTNLGLAYVLALISPGPSLVIILHNSLVYTKEVGFWTAVGITVGIAVQALYVLLGLDFLYQYPQFLLAIKILCSFYLIYLGATGFRKAFSFAQSKHQNSCKTPNKWEALKQGFLIDVLNPVSLSFFLIIFSLYIPDQSDIFYKSICWLGIILLGSIWFTGVSLLFPGSLLKRFLFSSLGRFINIIISVVFIIFGIKLLIS